MRIWSLHPSYLDAKGIVALWRETLLAQKVLLGQTKGYKHHPQLDRFKAHADPIAAIGCYLSHVCDEAERRGYNFDRSKILQPVKARPIAVTDGQMKYEFEWLRSKLKTRSPADLKRIGTPVSPTPHPLFKITSGPVADWER